jgi:competence protein ComEA
VREEESDEERYVRQRLRSVLDRAAGPTGGGSGRAPAGVPHAVRDAVPDGEAVRPDMHPRPPVGPALTGLGAFDPGRRGVRALAAVAALVVLVAAVIAWRSRPRTDPVDAAPPLVTVTHEADQPVAASGAAAEVVVAVAGKVRRPGLVRLPAGARVADALHAAGGALPGIDASLLNPARRITDGELILVGVTPPPGAPPVTGPGSDPAAPAAAPGGRVNLNTATLAQLDTLPGVGPVLAQRILDHRERQGGFRSVGDLRQVDGIGAARYEQLKDLVTV